MGSFKAAPFFWSFTAMGVLFFVQGCADSHEFTANAKTLSSVSSVYAPPPVKNVPPASEPDPLPQPEPSHDPTPEPQPEPSPSPEPSPPTPIPSQPRPSPSPSQPPAPPALEACATAVTPDVLPELTVGVPVSLNFQVNRNEAYEYWVMSGSVPLGLTLDYKTGALSGVPAIAAPSPGWQFMLDVHTNRDPILGNCRLLKSYAPVVGCLPLEISSKTLPDAKIWVRYSETLRVLGPENNAFYLNPVFSVYQGNLPSGFTLNSTTGALTGLTNITGDYWFVIKALYPSGCFTTQSYSFSVK